MLGVQPAQAPYSQATDRFIKLSSTRKRYRDLLPCQIRNAFPRNPIGTHLRNMLPIHQSIAKIDLQTLQHIETARALPRHCQGIGQATSRHLSTASSNGSQDADNVQPLHSWARSKRHEKILDWLYISSNSTAAKKPTPPPLLLSSPCNPSSINTKKKTHD